MKSIILKGCCFVEETQLDICLKNNNPKEEKEANISVIYGKNGSGKTTLSNAFNFYIDKKGKFDIVRIVDLNNEDQSFANNLYVFNEKYINDNIYLKSDGTLNAIVLFGKVGDLEKQIESVDDKISNLQQQIKDINIDKYNEKGSEFNINEHLVKIKDELKKHGLLENLQLITTNE